MKLDEAQKLTEDPAACGSVVRIRLDTYIHFAYTSFSSFFLFSRCVFKLLSLLTLAMMSNVLAAAYSELIIAVSLCSGVPAGCFVSSSGASAA